VGRGREGWKGEKEMVRGKGRRVRGKGAEGERG